jgi:hypothetical protein
LEKYIHEALVSKISFIVSSILQVVNNPELYTQVKSQQLKQLLLRFVKIDLVEFDSVSENSLLSKWSKIQDKIVEGYVKDGVVSLNYKIDDVYIVDGEQFEYYKNLHNVSDEKGCVFTYLTSYISVDFPLYRIINEMKDHLLGVNIENNDLEVLKAIYQYIFKDIDKKNAYSSLASPLLNEKLPIQNHDIYIVDRNGDFDTPTISLIKAFNSLAAHLDAVLDDISGIDNLLVKNKKFNLNLTNDEINEIISYSLFTSSVNTGSVHDFKSELTSNSIEKLEELNKRLNEASKKPHKAVSISKAKSFKYKADKNRSISCLPMQGMPSTSLFGISTFDNNSNILDSTSESFENKIPNKERKRHTYILAGSGSGKTSLIETLLYGDCQKKDQSTIVFDLMGKATKSILKFVKEPERVLIIDPYLHSSIIPIINPFELESKDELSIENRTKAIINAFDIALNLKDGWSVNMKAVLEPCISTLLRKGGSDIYELQRFMNDTVNTDLVKLGKESPVRGHRSFFNQEFYNESYEITKRAISAKLQVFLNDPTFASLVTGKSTINLKKEVDTKGRIVVFKIPSKQKLFARLMMEMIQDMMRERINLSDDEIVPTHIYLDEFQNYLTPTIEEVLSESRNFQFYVTFAHQSFVHLSPRMQGIVLSNSNIKIVGQCSYDDGKKMSKEMKADFETIEALEQGEFIFKVGSNAAVRWRNTDRFIKDSTPYHTKQSTKHIKHQFKNYYVYKEVFSSEQDSASAIDTLKPMHEEF